jgi:hypothetical protein
MAPLAPEKEKPMDRSPNVLLIVGALVALAGIVVLAVPQFTTARTVDVAKIGDLKVEGRETTAHDIPPVVGGAAVILGILLIGGGVYYRR